MRTSIKLTGYEGYKLVRDKYRVPLVEVWKHIGIIGN